MKTVRLTMAQALLRFIDAQFVAIDGQNVKFVHGVSAIFGHGNVLGIGEALENEPHNLKFYRGSNEQGMCHTAIAFAKQKKRRQIIAVTSSIGPGATNMVTAAATATINRIPLLLLPGDTFSSRAPDPVLQQLEHPESHSTSVNECFRPVSRYFDRIDRPEQLMSALTKAISVLLDPERTGAVTICLPQDVQCEAFDYPSQFFNKKIHRIDLRSASSDDVVQALDLISHSERPLVIAGGGVRYAAKGHLIKEFADTFGLPVAETQAGKGVILPNDERSVGGVGVIGTKVANHLAHESDLIIALGTRLSDFTTASKTAFNKSSRIINVNIDAFDKDKLAPTLAIRCDVGEFMQQVIERGSSMAIATSTAYQNEINEHKSNWIKIRDDMFNSLGSASELDQVSALGVINRCVSKDSIVVSAAGSLPGDMQRLWHVGDRDGFHLEYGYSCMGYEVAGGLGAKIAEPGRNVWVLVGDGSYLMMHSEIVTALAEGIKINVILFDSKGFSCIKGLQCAQGSKGYGTDLRMRNKDSGKLDGSSLSIDFAKYAEALGVVSFKAHTIDDLATMVKQAECTDASTLIEIKVAQGSQSPGFDTMWQVGVSEQSRSSDVTAAHKAMTESLQQQKLV